MSDFRYDKMSPSSVYPEVRVTHLPSGESRIFDQHKSPLKNLLDARRWAYEKSCIYEYIREQSNTRLSGDRKTV